MSQVVALKAIEIDVLELRKELCLNLIRTTAELLADNLAA